jgi:DNA-directed RNA polymerase specialized sigma24 family protein
VLAILHSLPEREREALVLRTWDDLDPARAAIVAGCSTKALTARYQGARRRVAKQLTLSGLDADSKAWTNEGQGGDEE